MGIFHPLEVVGRGIETQLQMGEKVNKITVYSQRSVYMDKVPV